ncbi:MAG: PDZ domain-containing protein [Planctomycetota bacterium]
MSVSNASHLNVILPLLVVCTCMQGSEIPAAEPDSPSADAAVIQTLAERLDAPEFARREAATAKLKTMGMSVADAVTAVGLSGSPEAGIRAVAVLKQLYLSDDAPAVNAGEDGLKKLRDTGSPPVAVEAQTALRSHYFTIRQRRAVKAIREMNGQVKFERSNPLMFEGQVVQPPEGWVRQAAVGPDWTGGDEGFRHFSQLDSLQVLYRLSGHPISDQAFQAFKRDLPEVDILDRGAAFLGVTPATDSLGCLIQSVLPDSSAAVSGIELMDVVVEIEGEPIQTADDLVNAVAQHGPGKQIRVVVLRFPTFNRQYNYKYKLTQMRFEPQSFSPLLAIGIMSQVRREIPVTLKKWQINN